MADQQWQDEKKKGDGKGEDHRAECVFCPCYIIKARISVYPAM